MFEMEPVSLQNVDTMWYEEEKNRLSKMRDRPVVLHNSFIQTREYGGPSKNKANASMSKSEKKMFLYIVSCLKPQDEDVDAVITLDMKEFCRVCGIGGKNPSDLYRRLKDTIKKLADRSDWQKTPDGGERLIRIIRDVELGKKYSSVITLKIAKEIVPYLYQLKDNFTMYPVGEQLQMTSKYGMDLHALLKSYAYQGRLIRFDINRLKRLLDATHLKDISAFKRRCMDLALKDINTYTALKVEARYEKTGRTITHVVFYVRDLSKSTDELDYMEYSRRKKTLDNSYDENDQMSLFALMGPYAHALAHDINQGNGQGPLYEEDFIDIV